MNMLCMVNKPLGMPLSEKEQSAEDHAEDLREKLERSGLPKKALAESLGLDAAVVSRIFSGQRELRVSELRKVEYFLSAVPESADKKTRRAIRRLKNAALRRSVCDVLLNEIMTHAALRRGEPNGQWIDEALRRSAQIDPSQFESFLKYRMPLRLEEVSHLAQAMGLDLRALVDERRLDFVSPPSELQRWATTARNNARAIPSKPDPGFADAAITKPLDSTSGRPVASAPIPGKKSEATVQRERPLPRMLVPILPLRREWWVARIGEDRAMVDRLGSDQIIADMGSSVELRPDDLVLIVKNSGDAVLGYLEDSLRRPFGSPIKIYRPDVGAVVVEDIRDVFGVIFVIAPPRRP